MQVNETLLRQLLYLVGIIFYSHKNLYSNSFIVTTPFLTLPQEKMLLHNMALLGKRPIVLISERHIRVAYDLTQKEIRIYDFEKRVGH